MAGHKNFIARRIPFLKLFISFASGIIIQWYGKPTQYFWITIICIFLPCLLTFFLIPYFQRFKYQFIAGISTFLLFAALGGLFTHYRDIRNHDQWIGKNYTQDDFTSVIASESPVERSKSVRVNSNASHLLRNGHIIPVKGKVIIYIKKILTDGTTDTLLARIEHGSRIIFKKKLQLIPNSGNPAGFDYRQFCLFQGITHQVYMKSGDYIIAGSPQENVFLQFIINIRRKILSILEKNIPDEKELGLAEAILIGYKEGLDKTLVQSYANTGVVHIIAISGLHIGLVYWLLVQLLKPLRKIKCSQWLTPLLIVTGLWLFSILAGAQPSILRSALMFTCIVIGENLSRKNSIYNSLALSAFILLCINPFWLWDIGFQLSYAAVLGIVLFMRPIYNWFYIKNKWLDRIWKLNAVTLAAQVFTIPLCVYYFHQFPNYFILSNLVAVPLSSLILFLEILLCGVSFIPGLADLMGKVISWLIAFMNSFVEKIESLPFSVSQGLLISIPQAILLLIFAAGMGYWQMEKVKSGLYMSLVALLAFIVLRTHSFIESSQQEKLVVYNIPQHSAIDILSGQHYLFVGDSALMSKNQQTRFHLEPSRIRARAGPVDSLDDFCRTGNFIQYRGVKLLLIDTTISFKVIQPKPVVDLLILSKNPRIYLSKLSTALDIRQVVIDGSVPEWKSRYWKKDCDSLHISCHDVSSSGAFVMKFR